MTDRKERYKKKIKKEIKKVLGEKTFKNVLYDGKTDIVDVTTGKTPKRLDKSIQEAKEFAEEMTKERDTKYVAKKVKSSETQVEGGAPYVACFFGHYSITGSMELHEAYREAWCSSDYTVEVKEDYKSGDLTITVEED